MDEAGPNLNVAAVSAKGEGTIRLTGAIPSRVGSIEEPSKALNRLSGTTERFLWGQDIRLPVALPPQKGWHEEPTEFYKLRKDVKSGFLTSWNHKPYLLMPDSDLYYDSWYKWDRAEIINTIIEGRRDWTLETSIGLNALLSRIDMNMDRFRPFLVMLQKHGKLSAVQAEKLNIILSWNGLRLSGQGGTSTTCAANTDFAHPGEAQFNEWYEGLGGLFKRIILENSDEALKKVWNGRYGKLKVAKLNFKKGSEKLTYDNSQNVHIFGKMMLANLKYAFNENPDYDLSGWNFLLDAAPAADASDIEKTKLAALKIMTQALDSIKTDGVGVCPSLHAFAVNLDRGVTMSSRVKELYIPYFRNKGAQNHVVEFSTDGAVDENIRVRSRNVVAPGVREPQGPDVKHSTDQIPLFSTDEYRDMGVFKGEKAGQVKTKSKL